MSSRDPVDQALDQALGCALGAVFAAIIGAFFGHWQNKQEDKRRQARTLRFSDTLELPDEADVKPARKSKPDPRPWQVRYASLVIFVGGYFSLGFLCAGLSAFGMEDPLAAVAAAIPAFAASGATGYAVVRVWHKRRTYKPQLSAPAIIQPPQQVINYGRARVYTVVIPKTTPWQPEIAARFMAQILDKYGRLTFQITAEPEQIAWRILDLRRGLDASVMKQTVYAFYPGAEVHESQLEPEEFKRPFYRSVMGFKQVTDPVFPIAYVDRFKDADPLASITHELSQLRPGERVTYTLFVADVAGFVYDQVENLLSVRKGPNPFQLLSPQGWADMGYELTNRDQQRLAVFDPQDEQVVVNKLANRVFQCLLLIQIDALSFERVQDLSRIDSQMQLYHNFPYGILARQTDTREETIRLIQTAEEASNYSLLGLLARWLSNASTGWQAIRLILDTRELAALWHLPHAGFAAPSIEWARNRVPMPTKARGLNRGLLLGKNEVSDRSDLVYLLSEDRATHINILGRTGVGKSTLSHHLITQDIVQGHGVAVIDPHGSLVRDVLQTSIPREREGDVVVLDIADVEYPPPLNPLAGTQTRAATARVISILEKLYGGFENAPRMANALSSALMTLSFEPQATVRDVVRLFTDEGYRNELLERLDDEVVEEFWRDEYEAVSASQQQQIREPVVYRMRTFYNTRDLYPILCHPGRIDFGTLMDERKIILVSLGMDEEQIPESERNLIGAILVSQLQMAAMKHMDRPHPFYVYIDEVQNFVTTSLDKVFSEARKYKLSLTVANQFLKQLTGSTLEAMMSNVGAMVVFQCGLDDARQLAPYMAPGFAAEDLVNLDKYQAAVKLRVMGETQPAFSLTPLPPMVANSFGENEREECFEREQRIRALSHEIYTPMTREDVLAWLAERYPRRGKVAGKADAGDFFEA